ncbi:DUF1842 domain-containing protein [Oxalobacteraceae sp. CFBP 13730]|nr:DUF1842 domain-containing protein [Oxalobacteraceae sp. CFBP 13730]
MSTSACAYSGHAPSGANAGQSPQANQIKEHTMANTFESVKVVTLTAGNQGMPGAPILTMALMIDGADGTVQGKGEITQALASPYGELPVSNITGQIRAMGFGPATRSLALKGTIFTTLKPPAIGTLEIPFSAFFVTDNDWVGRGYFNYPPNDVIDVPITPGLTLRAAATAT